MSETNSGRATLQAVEAVALVALLAAPIAVARTPDAAMIGEEPTLHLEFLAQIELDAWAWGAESQAELVGDRLLVSAGAGGLAVFDVSDMAHPSEIVRLDSDALGGQGGAATLIGDRLFVEVPERSRILVFDLGGPLPPLKLGEFGAIADVLALDGRGSRLLAHAGSSVEHPGGLYLFDATTPIPTLAGAYLSPLIDPGFAALDDGRAFLAITPAFYPQTPSVEVVDLSDASNPALLGRWTSPLHGNVTGIDVDSGVMALSAYWGGLWIVDVADPSAMQLVASLDLQRPEEYALDVELIGPFVLLLQGGPQAEMRQLDIVFWNRFDTPRIVDRLPLAGLGGSLVRDGRRLVLEEWIDDDADGYPNRKRIRLFEVQLDGAGTCLPTPELLCLGDGRFRVGATWRDSLGRSGQGRAAPLTDDSGTFWFFGPDNIELLVKVVDACDHPDFRSLWVFAAGLTDVEVTLTVIDTWTGDVWERSSALGQPFPSILDSRAFDGCLPGASSVAQENGAARRGPASQKR